MQVIQIVFYPNVEDVSFYAGLKSLSFEFVVVTRKNRLIEKRTRGYIYSGSTAVETVSQ